MTVLEVIVPGVPVPQGSLRNAGRGRTFHDNDAKLRPWRASIIAHTRKGMEKGGTWPLEGPVKLGVTFYLPRPKSAPKSRMWPDKKPDGDKLLRAVFDSLEQAGAVRNDSQIVQFGVTKVYGQPGVCLTLRPMAVGHV